MIWPHEPKHPDEVRHVAKAARAKGNTKVGRRAKSSAAPKKGRGK